MPHPARVRPVRCAYQMCFAPISELFLMMCTHSSGLLMEIVAQCKEDLCRILLESAPFLAAAARLCLVLHTPHTPRQDPQQFERNPKRSRTRETPFLSASSLF